MVKTFNPALFLPTAPATCAIPGCMKKVFVDSNNQVSRFCSQTCLRNSRCKRSGCQRHQGRFEYCSKNCRRLDNAAATCATPHCTKAAYVDDAHPKLQYDYCSAACYHAHSQILQTTLLVILSPTNSDYKLVQKHVNGAFRIKAVVRVVYPASLAANHLATGNNGFRVFRFHGTTLMCDIKNSGVVCSLPACNVCGILRYGFLNSRLKNKLGTFCAKDAQTSAEYGRSNTLLDRAMFLCNVFDPLNNAISILPNQSSILPRFLVIY